MPPKYTERPQAPVRVVLSPRRRLGFLSGKSRVNAVSRRRHPGEQGAPGSLAMLRMTEVFVRTPALPEIPSSVSAPTSLVAAMPRTSLRV